MLRDILSCLRIFIFVLSIKNAREVNAGQSSWVAFVRRKEYHGIAYLIPHGVTSMFSVQLFIFPFLVLCKGHFRREAVLFRTLIPGLV